MYLKSKKINVRNRSAVLKLALSASRHRGSHCNGCVKFKSNDKSLHKKTILF